MIIHNTKEGEYTEDKRVIDRILEISKIEDLYKRSILIVQYITDDYKSWNIIQNNINLEKQFIDILKLTEISLSNNPKSYNTWHIRYLLMKKLKHNNEIVKRDKTLINLLFKIDKRNLHCWSYCNKLYNDCVFPDANNYSYLHYFNLFDKMACCYTIPWDIKMYLYYFSCREKELLQRGWYIRRYKTKMGVVFKIPFVGYLEILDKRVDIEDPVLYIDIEGINNIDIEEAIINGKRVILEKRINEEEEKMFEDLTENRDIYSKVFPSKYSNEYYDIFVINDYIWS